MISQKHNPAYNPEKNFTHEIKESAYHFDPRSFRVKKVGKGYRIVFGCPKGEWQPRKQRCKVGVRIQKVMKPKLVNPPTSQQKYDGRLSGLKRNSWPDNYEGHVRAALLGWEHRRSRSKPKSKSRSQTQKEVIKLTPTQKSWLSYYRTQVEEGEPGKRLPAITGEWSGYSSSYPDWMKNQGWSRDEVLRVFDKLENSESFPEKNIRQLNIADTIKRELVKSARRGTYEKRRVSGGGKRSMVLASAETRGYRGKIRVKDEEEYPAWVMENPKRKGVQVGTYILKLPGKSGKRATVVRFSNGRVIRFDQVMNKKEAIQRAIQVQTQIQAKGVR